MLQWSRERFTTARRQAKLSQQALAKVMNLHWRTISKWETGDAHPKLDDILMAISFIGCELSDVLSPISECRSMCGEVGGGVQVSHIRGSEECSGPPSENPKK